MTKTHPKIAKKFACGAKHSIITADFFWSTRLIRTENKNAKIALCGNKRQTNQKIGIPTLVAEDKRHRTKFLSQNFLGTGPKALPPMDGAQMCISGNKSMRGTLKVVACIR